jgi:hypothetical protein
MELESIYPFLLLIAPLLIALLMEAIAIHLLLLKKFWAAVGIALVVNVLAAVVLYGGSLLLGKLGYGLNGLAFPLQAILFFWWLSVVADGLLLELLVKDQPRQKIYFCSILMNAVSWMFLHVFIVNSN